MLLDELPGGYLKRLDARLQLQSVLQIMTALLQTQDLLLQLVPLQLQLLHHRPQTIWSHQDREQVRTGAGDITGRRWNSFTDS